MILTKKFHLTCLIGTAEKVSVFRVILVRIFPHSDWIRRDTLRIQSECGKIQTIIIPNTDTFYAVRVHNTRLTLSVNFTESTRDNDLCPKDKCLLSVTLLKLAPEGHFVGNFYLALYCSGISTVDFVYFSDLVIGTTKHLQRMRYFFLFSN